MKSADKIKLEEAASMLGDLGKQERTQSKRQHNNFNKFSKISTKSRPETKCANMKGQVLSAKNTEDTKCHNRGQRRGATAKIKLLSLC